MLAVSGHSWNEDRVHPAVLVWFDMMLLLMSICVLAMIMWDAGEKQKNVSAALFLVAGILSMFFVFS